ncbi:hypothetical protein HNY73_001105 [Argiope bruennichi]|uniref:Uncharacterized protein n=1 Tax=Argiope bruennichi TaxID=94029 RepID=A0A8T0G099_ARGBR|nr:hypothetical protein HNY73_001105 [Argiope bruennichi]
MLTLLQAEPPSTMMNGSLYEETSNSRSSVEVVQPASNGPLHIPAKRVNPDPAWRCRPTVTPTAEGWWKEAVVLSATATTTRRPNPGPLMRTIRRSTVTPPSTTSPLYAGKA